MAKKTADDLDFIFNDDGDLEITGLEEGDELEEEEGTEEEQEEESEESEDRDSSDTDTRISNIEKTLNSLPNMIATSIATALSGNLPNKKEEEQEEEIPDELDNKQIINILSKRIDKAISVKLDSIMKKYEPALAQSDMTAQFQNGAAKYGQSFIDHMDLISKVILKSNGSLNVEQAWDVVKSFSQRSKSKPDTKDIVAKTKATKVDADSKTAIGDHKQPRGKFQFPKDISDSELFDRAFGSAVLKTAGRKKTA